MGLDNGIMLRVKTDTIIPADIFISKYDITHEGSDLEVRLDYIPAEESKVEICYWRKCWALRNEIVKVLDVPYMGGCVAINAKQLDEIIDIIVRYTDKEYYDYMANGGGYGGMLWEYDEMAGSLKQQLRALRWCKELMETQDIELEFYDSY